MTTPFLVAALAPPHSPTIARGRAAVNERTAGGTARGELRRKTFHPHCPPARSLVRSAGDRPQDFTTEGAEYVSVQHKHRLRRRHLPYQVASSFAASPRPCFRRATPLITQQTTPCYTVSLQAAPAGYDVAGTSRAECPNRISSLRACKPFWGSHAPRSDRPGTNGQPEHLYPSVRFRTPRRD